MCGQKLQLLLVGGTLPLIRRKPGWVCRAILIAKFFQRFGVNLNFAAWRTQRIFHRIGAEITITNVLFVLLAAAHFDQRSEEHTSELQSRFDLVCSLLLEKKK